MANTQSVRTKLQPINNTNKEINPMASSNKNEYFPCITVDKENIGSKQSATNKVSFGALHFVSPEKYRARKNSDSVIYHSKQEQQITVSKKIHHLINHWESRHDVHPKRHLSENAGSSANSHAIHDGDAFPKPDFKIYSSNEEIKGKEASSSKHRTCKAEKIYFKKASIQSVTSVAKKIKLLKPTQNKNQIEKEIKGSSHLKLKNPRVENLIAIDTNTESSITPQDALAVPLNIDKIKIHHKKSALDEKYRENQVDNLPPELIYNLEYMEDFIEFQMELERSHKLSSEFLTKNVTPGQRRTVVSFLIKVTAYCSYPSFILYQTIKIFDSMLDSKIMETEELQLFAVTALWITLKRLHTVSNIPSAKDILSFTKHGYSEKEFYKCEADIMITLKCEISYIDPFSILAYYFININSPFIQVTRTDMMYYCASYMIDVSLLSSGFCHVPILALIAAAAEIALFITLAQESDLQHPHWQFWRGCLPKICPKGRQIKVAAIEETRKKLIKLALLSNNSSTDYIAVYKKYKRSRYGRISEILIGKLLKVSPNEYNS